jgi:hypothetical protein
MDLDDARWRAQDVRPAQAVEEVRQGVAVQTEIAQRKFRVLQQKLHDMLHLWIKIRQGHACRCLAVFDQPFDVALRVGLAIVLNFAADDHALAGNLQIRQFVRTTQDEPRGWRRAA